MCKECDDKLSEIFMYFGLGARSVAQFMNEHVLVLCDQEQISVMVADPKTATIVSTTKSGIAVTPAMSDKTLADVVKAFVERLSRAREIHENYENPENHKGIDRRKMPGSN